MKKIALIIAVVLVSCTAKHYHDGKYKGTVYTGGSLFNLHEEVLMVDGNEMEIEKYTIGGTLADHIKVTCRQLPDRLEYQDGDIERILTKEGDNLRWNYDVLFKKIGKDDTIPQVKMQPVLKNNGDGTLSAFNPPVVERVSTKRFTDGDGWDYVVTVHGDQITLKSYPNIHNEYYPDKTTPQQTIRGSIVNGRITTKGHRYKLEDNKLYEMNNEGTWNEYWPVE